mmetsp:Transcript_41391/g.54416  ORF Transcript_41391/g.54416 Transcript_41391/m.54416 type:complete len:351 (+) Transcript_41391:139-1191(+)
MAVERGRDSDGDELPKNQYSWQRERREEQKNILLLECIQIYLLSIYYFFLKVWLCINDMVRKPLGRWTFLLLVAFIGTTLIRVRFMWHLHSTDHRWAEGSTLQLPSVILRDRREILMDEDRSKLTNSTETNECTNTLQGATLITDSDGYVCLRRDLDPKRPGCCAPAAGNNPLLRSNGNDENGERILQAHNLRGDIGNEDVVLGKYSCWSCDLESFCCKEYELCVSCCMHPQHRLMLEDFKNQSTHFFYQRTPVGFEFCRYKCRTSSGSVINENSYRNPQKHCYGEYRPQLLPGSSINSDGTALALRQQGLLQGSNTNHADEAEKEFDPYLKKFNNTGKIKNESFSIIMK